jgi:UDP-glucose 6-dehydrogenase
MKITVIGNGWVGKSMMELFPDAYMYSHGIGTQEEANKGDVAFICVPSPNKYKVPGQIVGEAELDTSIVEEVVAWCKCPLLIMRSTVNPGTCDYLMKKYAKPIVMQPEYLGETPAHPLIDPKTRPFLIFGGWKDHVRKAIEVYHAVYNANTTIRTMSSKEAEIVKLTENRAIAFKVAQCQELYDVCEKAGIDYYVIRDAVYGDDPRFNLWFTFVYPDKRGFKSKCIPKDVYAWCAWAESIGYQPKLTRDLLARNKKWIGVA